MSPRSNNDSTFPVLPPRRHFASRHALKYLNFVTRARFTLIFYGILASIFQHCGRAGKFRKQRGWMYSINKNRKFVGINISFIDILNYFYLKSGLFWFPAFRSLKYIEDVQRVTANTLSFRFNCSHLAFTSIKQN